MNTPLIRARNEEPSERAGALRDNARERCKDLPDMNSGDTSIMRTRKLRAYARVCVRIECALCCFIKPLKLHSAVRKSPIKRRLVSPDRPRRPSIDVAIRRSITN